MIVLFLFINCATAPRDVVMLLLAYEFLWGLVPCLMLMMNCLKTKGFWSNIQYNGQLLLNSEHTSLRRWLAFMLTECNKIYGNFYSATQFYFLHKQPCVLIIHNIYTNSKLYIKTVDWYENITKSNIITEWRNSKKFIYIFLRLLF